MATAYNSAQIAAGKQPRVLPQGFVTTQINTFLNSTAFVINDTVNFIQLEADPSLGGSSNGPIITNVKVGMPPMDSSTGFTWVVGDSVTANRYITTNTSGQSSAGALVAITSTQYAALGYQPFKSDFGSFGTYTAVSLQTYTIILKVTAAAVGTPTTGNTITMSCDYSYDP